MDYTQFFEAPVNYQSYSKRVKDRAISKNDMSNRHRPEWDRYTQPRLKYGEQTFSTNYYDEPFSFSEKNHSYRPADRPADRSADRPVDWSTKQPNVVQGMACSSCVVKSPPADDEDVMDKLEEISCKLYWIQIILVILTIMVISIFTVVIGGCAKMFSMKS
jgi:hypothetical protein